MYAEKEATEKGLASSFYQVPSQVANSRSDLETNKGSKPHSLKQLQ
jgi:hypothetical protein